MAGKSRLFRGKARRPILAAFAAALALFAFAGAANPATAFAADETPSFAPGAYKSIKANDDGTYTLSLNVTGKQQSSEETVSQKADVILVMDVSSTMDEPFGSGTRLEATKRAALSLVDDLLSDNASGDVRVAVVPFGTIAKVTQGLTTEKTEAEAAIKALHIDSSLNNGWVGQGTNWEGGLGTAGEIDTDQDAKKYIVFLSDGIPETVCSHYEKSTRKKLTYNGTEWGYSQGSQWHKVEDSDIEVDYDSYDSEYGNYWGSTYQNRFKIANETAHKVAQNAKFFSVSVGMGNDHDKMADLQKAANGDGTSNGCFRGDNTEELNKAFENISSTIVKTAEFDNVVVTDTLSEWVSGVTNGTTNLTANGHVDSATFTYQKNGQPWTGSDVPAATVETDGTIKWDLSSVGTLEKDVTYTVSFTIAPNQAAFEKAVEGDGDNLPGVVLPTNGKAQVAFNIVETVNGNPVSKPADPVAMKTENITVYPSNLMIEKKWENAGNIPESIQVKIKQDGKEYETVKLKAPEWKTEISVAGGPQGHKYTFEELAVDGYETTYSASELSFKGLKDQRQTLTITNTRSTGTLWLTKHVNGNAANTNYAYDFVLTCEVLEGQDVKAKIDGAEQTIKFNGDGISEPIKLTHGQQLELAGLPTGTVVSIKETNLNNDQAYSQTLAAVGSNKPEDVNPNKNNETDSFSVTIAKGENQVTFTNTSTAAPNNGVSNSNITPMVGLFAAATIGGTALFAANRRKHGQDAWKE